MLTFIKYAARWILIALAGRVLTTRRLPSPLPPGSPVYLRGQRWLVPISNRFGFDRGLPIDRYYIEDFLASHQDDVRGRVLEIGDNTYTCRYGGDRVAVSDVLHVDESNPQATIVGDLENADHIPSGTFDCIILTQTLHLIYDVRAAICTLHRVLKPGGVLLATFPGISQISSDRWSETWYWSFTILSAQRMFGEVFPPHNVCVKAYGNVFSTTAFLYGLAVKDLRPQELDFHDPHYEMLITLRAAKPGLETPEGEA